MKIHLKLALLWAFTVALGASALDRQAFTFTTYNLKVTIDPVKQGFLVTGSVQARNDSKAPQKNIVLQI